MGIDSLPSVGVERPSLKVDTTTYRQEYELLQRFVKEALIEGSDYGKLEEKGKSILYLPGAEKLADAYGLIGGLPIIVSQTEEWEADIPYFSYIVAMPFVDRETGRPVGYGIGSCNSMETKYRWRNQKVWCNRAEERKNPPDSSEGWELKTWGNKAAWIKKTANEETPELVNTIVKMAAKRGYVDGVLKILRASAIFTQDLEDFPSMVGSEKQAEGTERYCTKCQKQIKPGTVGDHNVSVEDIITWSTAQAGKAQCLKCCPMPTGQNPGQGDGQKAGEEGQPNPGAATPEQLAEVDSLREQVFGADDKAWDSFMISTIGHKPEHFTGLMKHQATKLKNELNRKLRQSQAAG